ncbi:PAS domain-containing protein [Arsukibacterium sp.]|uniref:PAS domain-containing sensor histidine kinase n=1 Tax=Arsukibacterium sp. TaxID=1977258 RepID=UPI003569F1E9
MYRSVLEGTRIGTWQWNIQTGDTVFNERWAQIVGYTLDELAPVSIATWLDFAHPDDLADSGKLLEQHFAGKLPFYDSKCRMKHKNGHWVWVHDRGRVVSWTEDGKPLMMYGTHADITEQKMAELELKASRDQFENLLANIPGMVYQYQQWPDGKAAFPYTSDNIKNIYGVTPEQVKQDSTFLFDKIHQDDLEGLAQSIDNSVQNLSLWQHQYRVCQDNKPPIWLSGRGTPERMVDGSTLWHGYIEDITDIKLHYLELERVNKALKITQQRLDTASENALIGFWQASLKTGELWWSPVIYQIFGFSETVTPSVDLFKSTLHPQDAERVFRSEQSALETGVHDVVHRIIRPDGTIRWVHELAKMLPPQENPELIMVGSVQDVTERMQLQQMKDQFVSTVSHELRTPLTAISGALSLLLSGHLAEFDPKVSKLLQIAQGNTNRLQHLINDLLDIEKLTAGKVKLDMEALLLKPQLELALSNLQPFALEYQVTLVFQFSLNELQIVADSQRLQQVLANLLSNAIKFSGPGKTVTLSAAINQHNVRVSVQDQGPGIPPEFQPRLFERFAQADGSSRRDKGGTGLGLAISKGLLAQMNGQIGFDTQKEVGTTFYFELPWVSATISDSGEQ